MTDVFRAATGVWRRQALPVALWALAFWLFTYALLFVRSEMIDAVATPLFGPRRLGGTGAGALCFAAVLLWIRQAEHRLGGSRAAAILATVLPASLLVLGARAATDVFVAGEVRDLAYDVRWTFVWAAYFGLWVSAAMALKVHALRAEHRAAARPAAAVPSDVPAAAPAEAWGDVIDTLAAMMADLPEADRAAIARHLRLRAGYELAEDPLPDPRRALAHRLAERLHR